jgi:hypothetical protein
MSPWIVVQNKLGGELALRMPDVNHGFLAAIQRHFGACSAPDSAFGSSSTSQ